MAFVDASFVELRVRDRHDSEAYAKITNDGFQNVAKKNKGGPITFVDDKVMKMVTSFYSTLLAGPDGSKEAADKVLALIAKSRADRKKVEEAAKNVNAAGAAGKNKHADRLHHDRDSKATMNNLANNGEEEYYDEDYDEEYEEYEEEEAAKPVVVQKSLAEIEAEKKKAAAAFVMPKKTGAKTLVLGSK